MEFGLQQKLASANSLASVQTGFWRLLPPSPGTQTAKWTKKCFWILQLSLVIGLVLTVRLVFAQPLPDNRPRHSAARAKTESRQALNPDATLTLRAYNYAQAESGLLAGSEKVAGEIFENVGIEIVWVDCPVSKTQSQTYPACLSDMGTTDLVLRIFPRHMAEKLHSPDEPFGFAQPCPENASACELTVFYFRVDELASKGYRADRVLGYAIAHEVTHVLIGPGHSEEGIMRGEWSRYDLQHISLGLQLDFTDVQSKQLRNAVLRRTTPPS